MLVAFPFFGYAHRTHSSRELERQTRESHAYMSIADAQQPDHDTIATIRCLSGEELKSMFPQVLEVAQAGGRCRMLQLEQHREMCGGEPSWVHLEDPGGTVPMPWRQSGDDPESATPSGDPVQDLALRAHGHDEW